MWNAHTWFRSMTINKRAIASEYEYALISCCVNLSTHLASLEFRWHRVHASKSLPRNEHSQFHSQVDKTNAHLLRLSVTCARIQSSQPTMCGRFNFELLRIQINKCNFHWGRFLMGFTHSSCSSLINSRPAAIIMLRATRKFQYHSSRLNNTLSN